MRKALALIQASWRTQRSYRVSMILSVLSLGVTVLPVYFVSKALQPYMASSIADQGKNYFGFLVIGFIALMFVSTTVNSIPDSVAAASARERSRRCCPRAHRFPSLLAGMVGYSFVWTAVKAVLFLALAMVLGLHLSLGASLSGIFILVLIVLAHIPFALDRRVARARLSHHGADPEHRDDRLRAAGRRVLVDVRERDPAVGARDGELGSARAGAARAAADAAQRRVARPP